MISEDLPVLINLVNTDVKIHIFNKQPVMKPTYNQFAEMQKFNKAACR
jgi:hypothetical protein